MRKTWSFQNYARFYDPREKCHYDAGVRLLFTFHTSLVRFKRLVGVARIRLKKGGQISHEYAQLIVNNVNRLTCSRDIHYFEKTYFYIDINFHHIYMYIFSFSQKIYK